MNCINNNSNIINVNGTKLVYYCIPSLDDKSLRIIKLNEVISSLYHDDVKIKILKSGGLDIVLGDCDFITDINLNNSINIRNNHIVKNYKKEKYWALTSRMRGYNINFGYSEEFNNKIYQLSTRTYYIIKSFYRNNNYVTKYFDFDDHYINRLIDRTDNKLKKLSLNIAKYSYANGCLLIVEYMGSDIYQIKYKKIRNKNGCYIIDLFNENNNKQYTIISCDGINASPWDDNKIYKQNYNNGIGLYRNIDSEGIILMGSINNDNVFNYGKAMDKNILIPDYYTRNK
jgi:hypothetical protein